MLGKVYRPNPSRQAFSASLLDAIFFMLRPVNPDAPHPLSTPLSFQWIGDSSLRIGCGGENTPASRDLARRVLETLDRTPVTGLLDRTPAFATVLLRFRPSDTPQAEARVRLALRGLFGAPDDVPDAPPARTLTIPVCYDPHFALDLESVAAIRQLSTAEVIRLHTQATYRVAFIGFTPGFPYLTGLPEALAVPRHTQPRTRVPAGSVAIASDQAGIYPREIPGGWRILGRTPLTLFDPARESPSLLSMGDHVRFVPISREEFERLRNREHLA